MTHFSDIEIHRWRDSGPGSDHERIVAHIAECAECATRYAAAIREDQLLPDPAGPRIRGRRRWIAPLAAAAAVLVIAIAIPFAKRRNETVPDLHFRGAGVHALSPQGTIDQTDVEFVWTSSAAAASYRVEISNATGVIETHDTRANRLHATLKPGVDYWWSVTALDAGGKPLTTSRRLMFTVR